MNYIYDVLLNFDDDIYEHYEWNMNDNIYHIKKIPIFQVDEKTINDIQNYKIVIPKAFLDKIKNKTEIYLNRASKPIEYACVIGCNKKVLALKLNNDCAIIKYSKMLITEELETIELINKISKTTIEYKKGTKLKKQLFKTKEEIKKTKYLETKIKNSSKEQLEYLYYEIYNKQKDAETIKEELYQELEGNWKEINNKMYDFYNLITNSK